VPKLVDDLVDRHGLVRVQQEQCENCALLVATKRQTTTAVVMNLERPEDAEIHWAPNLTNRS
jgi:hypothetical protein